MTIICPRSAGDVVAEIKMNLTVFAGVHVLVEGPSDCKFWKHHFDPHAPCEIVICGNKNVVIQAIAQLDQLAMPLMLGIVDDDFDSVLGVEHSSSNIVATDSHDIEAMFLNSPALQSILVEHGDETRIAAFENSGTKRVIDELVEMSIVFGKLRLINTRNSWGVSFESFSPWKYIDASTWRLDAAKLFADFRAQVTPPNDVSILIDSEISEPKWSIIQGHDAMAILSIGLRSALGNCQINERNLCSAFRLAYSHSLLRETNLFGSMSTWATTNDIQLFQN